MRYAIRDVIREDGVVGTLVLEDCRDAGDGLVENTTVVRNFLPMTYYEQEPMRVRRDPYCDFAESRSDTDDLVVGVEDRDRDRIFGE